MARKEIEPVAVETDSENAEARVYELAFHIDAELPQEEARTIYKKIKDGIEAHGTVVAEGEPEKIQLAYTISRMDTTGRRDFNSAYFGWIAYEAGNDGHMAALESVKESTSVIRFLDIRTTVEAAKHAAEIHEFNRNAALHSEAQAESAPEDDPVDAELDLALKEAGV